MERQKIVEDIGELKGRVLVFGGVYNNFQALKKMQEIAEELKIPSENIICTGDVVGYCAQPEEVVQSVSDWGVHSIAGNVEIQLREGKDDCGCDFREGSRCDRFSALWYPYSKIRLSKSSIDWMNTLPDFIRFEYGNQKGIVLHGSFDETADYIFKSTNWEIKDKNFKSTNTDLVLAGHCGLPFSQVKNKNYWLNAGVIGMPANDGTARVWYMLMDIDDDGQVTYEHHSFNYNQKEAVDLMLINDLPKQYATTLNTGIWDNCEILPRMEADQQGQKL